MAIPSACKLTSRINILGAASEQKPRPCIVIQDKTWKLLSFYKIAEENKNPHPTVWFLPAYSVYRSLMITSMSSKIKSSTSDIQFPIEIIIFVITLLSFHFMYIIPCISQKTTLFMSRLSEVFVKWHTALTGHIIDTTPLLLHESLWAILQNKNHNRYHEAAMVLVYITRLCRTKQKS